MIPRRGPSHSKSNEEEHKNTRDDVKRNMEGHPSTGHTNGSIASRTKNGFTTENTEDTMENAQNTYEKPAEAAEEIKKENQDRLWMATIVIIIAMCTEMMREKWTQPSEEQKEEEQRVAAPIHMQDNQVQPSQFSHR